LFPKYNTKASNSALTAALLTTALSIAGSTGSMEGRASVVEIVGKRYHASYVCTRCRQAPGTTMVGHSSQNPCLTTPSHVTAIGRMSTTPNTASPVFLCKFLFVFVHDRFGVYVTLKEQKTTHTHTDFGLNHSNRFGIFDRNIGWERQKMLKTRTR
jgi:hypothetical protein